MNHYEQPIYLLDDVEFDPARNCLRRNGDELPLRQKSLQVLRYLIEHRERSVGKEELLQHVWNGTAVTDDALVQIIVELRKLLGDDSRQPRFIKTIPKAGYRFIASVEALAPLQPATIEIEEITSVQVKVGETRAPLPAPRFNRKPVWWATLGGSLALLALAFFSFSKRAQPAAETALPRVPGKQSVAVLYFENQSGERELDWLREGLADMLITGLSRSPRLLVLSRQQLAVLLERRGRAQTNKLRLEDGLEIARRSQAESFVLGSFAKLGQQMRVDVQLFAASSGQLQAAESLVVEQPGEVLARLDLLSLKLATHLGVTPSAAESQPGLTGVLTSNADAYRYYSLALEQAQGYHSNEALALLEKAIALDPEFALAYARIGYIYAFVRLNERARARPYLTRADQLAHRLTTKERLYVKAWIAQAKDDHEGVVRALYDVIAYDPREVEAHFRLGFMLRHGPTKRPEEALRVLEQAAVIDPDAPHIQNQLGFLYLAFGRVDEAVTAHTRYVQLAPNEPNAYDSLGHTYSEAGRYQEALQTLNQALALNPDFHFATRHLGDVYFQLGRYRDALHQYKRYLALAPTDWDRAQANHLLTVVHLACGAFAQAEVAARQELRFGNDLGGSFLVALASGQLETAAQWRARWLAGATSPQQRELRLGAREYLLGLYALKTGQADQALAHFKAAQQADSLLWNIDTTIDGLGRAYLELGRTTEAIAEYERLVKLNPHWARAHYQLGQAYERKGEADKARAAYQRFLQVWQAADVDIPEVQQAKASLATTQ